MFDKSRVWRRVTPVFVCAAIVFVAQMQGPSGSPTESWSYGAASAEGASVTAYQLAAPLARLPDSGALQPDSAIGRALARVRRVSPFLVPGVFATLTTICLFLVTRNLGGGAFGASAAAIGIGVMAPFWAESLMTGVPGTTALWVMAALFALVHGAAAWRRGWILAGFAGLAFATANHPSALAIVPAVVAYLWIMNRRLLPAPAGVVGALFLLAAGLVAFGVGVSQASRAWPAFGLEGNLEWLSAVQQALRGGRSPEVSWLVSARHAMPAVWRQMTSDLGVLGYLLLAFGLWRLWSRRWRDAVLVTGALAGSIVFASQAWGPDLSAALIPLRAMAWIGVGLGATWMVDASPGTWARTGSVLVAFMVPVAGLVSGYTARHTTPIPWVASADGLLQDQVVLPSAIVAEDAFIDRLVFHQLGRSSVSRPAPVRVAPEVQQVDAALRRGLPVVAFHAGGARLAQVHAPTIERQVVVRSVRGLLARLSHGTVVALVAAGPVQTVLGNDIGAAFEPIGARGGTPRPDSTLAIVGVAGSRGSAFESVASGNLSVEIKAGEPIGNSGAEAPARIRLRSVGGGVWIDVNEQTVAYAGSGAALAVLAPDGRLLASYVLAPDLAPQLASVREDVPFYQVASVAAGQAAGPFLFQHPLVRVEEIRLDVQDDARFRDGWYPPESAGFTPFRWTSALDARLDVSLLRAQPLRVSVEAAPAVPPGATQARLALCVNGTDMGWQTAGGGSHTYEWTVPASAWKDGANAVVIRVASLVTPSSPGGDRRALGASVTRIRFTRVD